MSIENLKKKCKLGSGYFILFWCIVYQEAESDGDEEGAGNGNGGEVDIAEVAGE